MHHKHTDLLPFYAAGTLAPDAAAALEAHLAACADCRAALAEWRQIAGAVRADAAARVTSLPPLKTAPARPDEAIPPLQAPSRNGHHRIHKEIPMITSVPLSRPHLPTLTLIAALLAVVLFGGALVMFGARLGDTETPPPPGGNGASGPIVIATVSPSPTLVPTATPLPEDHTPSAASPVEPVQTVVLVPEEGAPLPTPTPIPFLMPVAPIPAQARLEGFIYQAQGWNNQGPAALAMVLGYFDVLHDQQEIAAWVRPEPEDKWVNPWELVAYVNEQTPLSAITRVGGTVDLLKQTVASGYPVIVATGIEPEGDGWLGHYVVVSGYDDTTNTFTVQDSYFGANRAVKYGDLDAGWRQFNRAFIVVYRPLEREALAIALGAYADPVQAINLAHDAARRDAAAHPDDAWAWINMGSVYTLLGAYGSATGAFDKARALGVPWRLAWYHPEVYEAYYGAYAYAVVVALADETLAQTLYVEDAAYWKGMALAAQGDTARAAEAFAQVIDQNPHYLRMLRWKFQGEAFGPLPLSPATVSAEAVPGGIEFLTPTVPPLTPLASTPTAILPPTATFPPTPAP